MDKEKIFTCYIENTEGYSSCREYTGCTRKCPLEEQGEQEEEEN